jgi:hypothetical protein
MTRSLTRRLLLGTAPAAAAVASVPAAIAAPHPDAAIVRLVATLAAGQAEAFRLDAPYSDVVAAEIPQDVQARLDELSGQWHELRDQIGATQARTLEGLQAKARALMLLYVPGQETEADPLLMSDEDQLPWSLCRDLLAIGKVQS